MYCLVKSKRFPKYHLLYRKSYQGRMGPMQIALGFWSACNYIVVINSVAPVISQLNYLIFWIVESRLNGRKPPLLHFHSGLKIRKVSNRTISTIKSKRLTGIPFCFLFLKMVGFILFWLLTLRKKWKHAEVISERLWVVRNSWWFMISLHTPHHLNQLSYNFSVP